MLEFSWPSFGFAVVNFLVLSSLLWKFLHKPLLGAIEKRRLGLVEAREKARAETEQAQRTREEYERRLAAAAEERDGLLVEARRAAEEAGRKIMEKAGADAERELADARLSHLREQREALKQLRQSVADAALDVAGAVLAKVVDQDTEALLARRLTEKLDALMGSGESRSAQSGDAAVRVRSARPPSDEVRAGILDRIRKIAGAGVDVDFQTEPELVAGTRVEFTALAVDASLADVLARVGERLALPAEGASGEDVR